MHVGILPSVTKWFLLLILAVGVFWLAFRKDLAAYAHGFLTVLDRAAASRERTERLISETEVYRIRVGGVPVTVVVADTNEERSRGLSGKVSLPQEEGMLFLFPRASRYGFWMKDVLFPIDLLWITHGKVVGIEHRVPTVRPGAEPRLWYPPFPVTAVLEVNADWARAHGVLIGDPVSAIDALPVIR